MGGEVSKHPGPRSGHEAACIDHDVFVFGGQCLNPKTLKDGLLSRVEIFQYNLDIRRWSRRSSSSRNPTDIPPASAHGSSAVFSNKIYSFGGILDLESGHRSAEMHCLDVKKMEWSKVNVSPEKKPAARSSSTLCRAGDRLVMFGGYGDISGGFLQEGAQHKPNGSGKGWNNEIYAFYPSSGTWSPLKTSGKRPCPRSSHSCSLTSKDELVIFGGRSSLLYLNDLYTLSLVTLMWSEVFIDFPGMSANHVAIHLSSSSGNYLLSLGGCAGFNSLVKDCCIIDLGSKSVLKISLHGLPICRKYHSLCHFMASDKSVILFLYGGFDGNYHLDNFLVYEWNVNDPHLLSGVSLSLITMASEAASQGTKEQMKFLKSMNEKLVSANELLKEENAKKQDKLDSITELFTHLQSGDEGSEGVQTVRSLVNELQSLRQERDDLLRRNQTLEDSLVEETSLHSRTASEVQKLEEVLDSVDVEKRSLRRSKEEYEKELDEFRNFFDIDPSEVDFTSSRTLGSGSYGAVRLGRWRGADVAVKEFYPGLVLLEHNKRLCREELSICCKIRHPNTATVFGASIVDDTPLLLVMELLESSLVEVVRVARLCGNYLTCREQVDLAEGTVAGISYLHNLTPVPYVHGDIKMANVLTTRSMQAKVGDLGATHMLGASLSTGPMSPNYVAPERFQSRSSLESDVYSLGVTLAEIFTGEAAAPSKRYTQLGLIEWQALRTLCIRMVDDDPGKRPTAAHVLSRLEKFRESEDYACCKPKRSVFGKVLGDQVVLI
eukprot:m.8136 g.8136  ORF g.8136 m.8136 type:complete len:775 (+) comp20344_c0_seq4:55-2379(+)